jgi:hypothetical protein
MVRQAETTQPVAPVNHIFKSAIENMLFTVRTAA